MLIYFLIDYINKFIYILLLCFNFKVAFIKSELQISDILLEYSLPFTLLNNNILVFSRKGYFTFDSNYSLIYNYTFINESNIEISYNKDYPSFSQFSKEEGEYILSFALGNVYLFNNFGQIANLSNIQNDLINSNKTDSKNNLYKIISYKTLDLHYYYFIFYSYFSNSEWSGEIYILYYKMDIDGNNELIHYQNYRDSLLNNGFACQRIIQEDENDYIILFYQLKPDNSNINHICKISFEPENNFTFSNKKCLEVNSYFFYVDSAINDDYSKIYVCFTSGQGEGKCFYYKIKDNEFSKIYILADYCRQNHFYFHLSYFKINKEYIFSCIDNSNKHFIIKFKEDMSFLNPPNSSKSFNIENCDIIKTISIIYLFYENKYALLNYGRCYYVIKSFIYKITDYFIEKTNQTMNTDLEPIKTNEIIIDLNKNSIVITDLNEESTSIIKTSDTELISNIPEDIAIIDDKSNKITISSKVTYVDEKIKTNEYTEEIETTGKMKNTEKFENVETTNYISNNIIQSSEVKNIDEKSSESYIDEATQKGEYSIETNINTGLSESSRITQGSKTQEKSFEIIEICEGDKKIIENGSCVCNKIKGYYPIKYNDVLFNDECYNMETKPDGFYLNLENKYFDKCYKNCKTCNNHGNKTVNNCTLCAQNYMFTPDIKSSNCVHKCKYYYYYTYYGLYSCTSNFQCPRESKLLIRNKSKCINNCSVDNIYKYQYNGECYEKCPKNTKNIQYKCITENINSCSLSIYEFNMTYTDIESDNVELFTYNYVEEFNYTNNQIIKYVNDEYSLVIYKNSSCIKKLLLKIPEIDFGECYEKIRKEYNITEDLVIAILEKNVEIGSSITSYSLFNPLNGEKLNTSEICKNETIVMKENVLTISGVNSSLISFFANQGINVFNLSDRFYIDLCFHYKSPNEKDIPLRLRVNIFFPNISLCDEGCVSEGINLDSMESICYCPFTDFTKSSFISNTLKYSELLNEVYSFFLDSNLDVLYCIKDIFIYEYFKVCTGGFIIMTLIIIQSICAIYYSKRSKTYMKRYIFILSDEYISSFNNKKIEIKDNINKKNEIKDNIKKDLLTIKNNKKINKKKNDSLTCNRNTSKIKFKSDKNLCIINNSKAILHNSSNLNNIYSKKNKMNFKKIRSKKDNKENTTKLRKSSRKVKKKYNFKEYLSTDYSDMDLDDALEKDKRNIFQYFCDLTKENHLVINSIFVTDNIKPKSIKLIVLLISIDLYCLFNGLMFNESYISDIYNNQERENFFSFIPRSYSHLIFITIISKLINGLISCFYFEEKKIKGIFLRGKNKPDKIKMDIFSFIQKLEKYYLYLICTSYFITILTWVYISCFNNVYYNSRREWIKSSFLYYIMAEVIVIIFFFLTAVIRFLAMKWENEKIFNWSKNIIFE